MNAAVLTISTSVAAGRAADRSGPRLADHARAAGAEVVAIEVVPDEREQIEAALRRLCAAGEVSLVFTTGGTGLTPDDVTPEATEAVIERAVPGFAEAMRAEALRRTPRGILTRGVCGVAGRTLIVNFPGNPRAIEELFGVIAPALGHAVATLQGQSGHPHRH